MYTSYFVLFAHFFRKAYMKKTGAAIDKKVNMKSGEAIPVDYKKGKLE